MTWKATGDPLKVDEDAEEILEPDEAARVEAANNWLNATPEQLAAWAHADAFASQVADKAAPRKS